MEKAVAPGNARALGCLLCPLELCWARKVLGSQLCGLAGQLRGAVVQGPHLYLRCSARERPWPRSEGGSSAVTHVVWAESPGVSRRALRPGPPQCERGSRLGAGSGRSPHLLVPGSTHRCPALPLPSSPAAHSGSRRFAFHVRLSASVFQNGLLGLKLKMLFLVAGSGGEK